MVVYVSFVEGVCEMKESGSFSWFVKLLVDNDVLKYFGS